MDVVKKIVHVLRDCIFSQVCVYVMTRMLVFLRLYLRLLGVCLSGSVELSIVHTRAQYSYGSGFFPGEYRNTSVMYQRVEVCKPDL